MKTETQKKIPKNPKNKETLYEGTFWDRPIGASRAGAERIKLFGTRRIGISVLDTLC